MPRQWVVTHGKRVPIHSHQSDQSHAIEPNAQLSDGEHQDSGETKPATKKKVTFSAPAASVAEAAMRKAFKF